MIRRGSKPILSQEMEAAFSEKLRDVADKGSVARAPRQILVTGSCFYKCISTHLSGSEIYHDKVRQKVADVIENSMYSLSSKNYCYQHLHITPRNYITHKRATPK